MVYLWIKLKFMLTCGPEKLENGLKIFWSIDRYRRYVLIPLNFAGIFAIDYVMTIALTTPLQWYHKSVMTS